jgi:hypothetical protein
MQNPNISRLEYLDKLFNKLKIIYNVFIRSSTDYNLRDQVSNACKGIPEYRYILYNPASIYKTVCT